MLRRIGFILGDPAGIGPEVTAKAVAGDHEGYVPVLVGSRGLLERCAAVPTCAEFVDIPPQAEVFPGLSGLESGRISLASMLRAVEMSKRGELDAVIMGPITKKSLSLAGKYESELPLFQDLYGNPDIGTVVRGGSLLRATAVGHVRFTEIPRQLTQASVERAARRLFWMLGRTPAGLGPVAVAGLNPHAGDGGLYGDEEETILSPVIARLRAEGLPVSGPYAPDTVFVRAMRGEFRGVVFLYHDQGNIAMKSAMFGEGVVLYAYAPCPLVSVGHGSALDIAGKGVADSGNMSECIRVVKEMLGHAQAQKEQEHVGL